MTMPTTCWERDRVHSHTGTQSLGTRAVSPQGAQAAHTQRVGTHLIAIVHNYQVPQSQGSEELEHPWQRRLLQGRAGLHGLRHAQLAPIAHP